MYVLKKMNLQIFTRMYVWMYGLGYEVRCYVFNSVKVVKVNLSIMYHGYSKGL